MRFAGIARHTFASTHSARRVRELIIVNVNYCAVMGARHSAAAGQLGRVPRRPLAALLSMVLVLTTVAATSPQPTARRSASPPVTMLGVTLGLGCTFDGFALSIPLIFNGTVVPDGDSFTPVPYPAVINLRYPIISDIAFLRDTPYWAQSMTRSQAAGAGYLAQAIANLPAGEQTTIIGMSQGAGVAEVARAEMATNPDYVANAGNYRFVMVGDPYQPNGGILARFTSWSDMPILGDLIPFGRPGTSDSPFATTYYQNQYDGFADFPATFNLLAIANAVAGMFFEHTFPGYYLASPDAPGAVSTTVGNTTYITIPKRVSLLAPLRIAASLINAERFVDALDPILRVFIEMGYDRTADPSQVKQFSWITPLQNIREGLVALPAAIAQAWQVLWGAPYQPTLPQPVVSGSEAPTPVIEHPSDPAPTSPVAQAIRQAVENLTRLLTAVALPLAKLLRWVTGQTPSAHDSETAADRIEPAFDPAPPSVQPPLDANDTAVLDTPEPEQVNVVEEQNDPSRQHDETPPSASETPTPTPTDDEPEPDVEPDAAPEVEVEVDPDSEPEDSQTANDNSDAEPTDIDDDRAETVETERGNSPEAPDAEADHRLAS